MGNMKDKAKPKGQDTQAAKERYETLIKNIPDAIYSALPDGTGTTTFMSPRWKDWTGYVPDDFYRDHETWPKCIHPEDRERAVQGYIDAVRMKKEYIAEYRVIHRVTGEVRHLRDHGIPVKDETGKVIRIDGIVTDITVSKKLEDNLKKTHERLEEKVNKRTAELRAANRELKKIIDQQKQIEKELRQATNFMDNLIDSSLDCIVVADISGYLTRVNKYFLKLLGYEREEEVIGKHIAEFAPKENINYKLVTGEEVHLNNEYFECRKSMYKKLLEEGKVSNWQNYLVTKEGKLVAIEHTVWFLYSGKDDPVATVGIARDITERKAAEKALEESREFLEKTFRTSLEGIVVVDPQGNITMANDTFFNMLGYPEEELIGENMTLLRPEGEEHLEKTGEFLDGFVGKGYAKEFEFTWQRKDGTLIDVELNANLVKNEQGTFVWGVGSVRDITARKQAAEALKKSEEKYYNLIEYANDAIISSNSNGIIVGFNRSAEQMFGYSREEILGKSAALLVAPQNREEQKEEWKKLEEFGDAYDINHKILEWTALRKDGEEFPVEFTFYVLETGGEVIATSIIRDVSQRKIAEQKIINYQKRLKALTSQLTLSEEKERRRFAEYLHDEIGQYLFASQIQLEQLKSSKVSKESKEALDSIMHNIKHMIGKSRSLTFELSSPILHELGLKNALEWLAEHIYKQYNIKVELKDDRKEKLLNDDMKIFLYQAIRELLTNVAKHAQVKKAIVSIEKDNSNLQVNVEDRGVGFNHLNAEFLKDHNKGFGLFHINERVEQFGGQLQIETQSGRGTRITIIVPLSIN